MSTATDLADYYFEKECYFEAVTEYKRQLYFDKTGEHDLYLYKMARAYYRAGKLHLAEEPLIEAVTNSEISTAERDCLKLLAAIHWDNYDYDAMRTVLALLSENSNDEQRDQIIYITAWTYIYQADWAPATERLESVNSFNSKELVSDINNVSSVLQKSKKLASLMSNIIPGTGQLYSGDFQNGLYSFLLVGSVEASIIWNIVERAYFIAAIKYLFIFSRYSRGGLRNLARKIDKDNIDRIGYYLKDVSEKYPDPIQLLNQL